MASGFSNKKCIVPPNHNELMRGLNALRTADKLCDVTFIVEGRNFKAHRAVMAASSDYFCALLTGALREANEDEVTLNGISARAFKFILQYVYTSFLELRSDTIEDVLTASALFQMSTITECCERYLETQLDLENCAKVAALADLHAFEALQKKAYRFLCARFGQYVKTADWLRLPCRQLDNLISYNYPMDCSEEQLLEIVLEYCTKTNLTAELAKSIFKHLHFEEIPQSALDKAASLYEQDQQQNETVNYIKIMKTMSQQSSSSELPTPGPNVNSRSMELVLVASFALFKKNPNVCASPRSFYVNYKETDYDNIIYYYLPRLHKWKVLTVVVPHMTSCEEIVPLGNDLYSFDSQNSFCYSPLHNTWRKVANPSTELWGCSLLAVGSDTLYVVGVDVLGRNDKFFVRYIVSKDRWESLSCKQMPKMSSLNAGAVIGDKLYILGSHDGNANCNMFWCFDTKARNWTKLKAMLTPRVQPVLLAIDGKLYACDSYSRTKCIQVYDVIKDFWRIETKEEQRGSHHFNTVSGRRPETFSVAAAEHQIYYFTHDSLNFAPTVRWYDLDTKIWTSNTCEFPHKMLEVFRTIHSVYLPRARILQD